MPTAGGSGCGGARPLLALRLYPARETVTQTMQC